MLYGLLVLIDELFSAHIAKFTFTRLAYCILIAAIIALVDGRSSWMLFHSICCLQFSWDNMCWNRLGSLDLYFYNLEIRLTDCLRSDLLVKV